MENSTHLLAGKPLRDHLFAQIAAHIKPLAQPPKLTVVRIEGDPASKIYVNMKQKTAQKLGFDCVVTALPTQCDQAMLEQQISAYAADASVTGILLQLPLPAHLNARAALNKIPPLKDVDGLTPTNAGHLMAGEPQLTPATPLGVMRLIKHGGINVAGMNAVVIGSSNLVGAPLARLLTLAGATVTVCNSKTRDLTAHTQQADLIITAAGRPNLLTANMVKNGTVLVDVGINRLPDGSLTGDMDFTALAPKAKLITPVPGGVGPMTIASLMTNLVDAAYLQAGKPAPVWSV
jgi:methylenetetrahydrofolate dehydrogenase (NADP+)/methenyltetrahydrofolate cyclohydrolase